MSQAPQNGDESNGQPPALPEPTPGREAAVERVLADAGILGSGEPVRNVNEPGVDDDYDGGPSGTVYIRISKRSETGDLSKAVRLIREAFPDAEANVWVPEESGSIRIKVRFPAADE